MSIVTKEHQISIVSLLTFCLWISQGCSSQSTPEPVTPKPEHSEAPVKQSETKTEPEDPQTKTLSNGTKLRLTTKAPTIIHELSDGHMVSEKIARSMSTRQDALRECYLVAPNKEAGLHGENIVRFKINTYGKVTKAETTYDQLGDEISQCIRQVIKGTDFPRPTGDHVTVLYQLRMVAWMKMVADENQPKRLKIKKKKPQIVDRVNAGDLNLSDISRVFNEKLDPLKQCVSETLDEDSKLSVKITFRFVIEKDGSVTNPGTTLDELNNQDATSCLLKVLSSLKFPPPKGGQITVLYPCMFNY